MSIKVLLTLLFLFPQVDMGSGGRLRGCPDPAVAGKHLGTIQQQDWREISVNRVLSNWPGQFDELVCQGSKSCRMIVSKNRVIEGHCECCESFVFDIDPDSKQERLINIVIHHSSSGRAELLEDAKKLMQGTGVASDKIAILGTNPNQRIEWTTNIGDVQYDNLAEAQITKVGSNWEFYLSLTRELHQPH